MFASHQDEPRIDHVQKIEIPNNNIVAEYVTILPALKDNPKFNNTNSPKLLGTH